MTDEMMLQEFKIEAAEMFEDAENGLLAIDKGEDYLANYNRIFRAFHSLKGAAGMFGMNDLQQHMHKLESLFEASKKLGGLSKAQCDYFLDGIDGAKHIMNGDCVQFDHLTLDQFIGESGNTRENPANSKDYEFAQDFEDSQDSASIEVVEEIREEVPVQYIYETTDGEVINVEEGRAYIDEDGIEYEYVVVDEQLSKDDKYYNEDDDQQSFETFDPLNTDLEMSESKAITCKEVHVLIVDDEADVLEALGILIEEMGFRPHPYSSPKKALADILNIKPDIILSDIKMPEMSGIKFIENVKIKFPDVPIVLFSGIISSKLMFEAINHGVYSFVEKPFDVDQLTKVCKEAIIRNRTTTALNSLINQLIYLYKDLDEALALAKKSEVRRMLASNFKTILEQKKMLMLLKNKTAN